MSNFVVLDTETTGFNYLKTDRIIEIAAIKYDRYFQELDRFETLVNPKRDLGPQHVHGIDASWVLNAPIFDEISDDLLVFLNDSVLIGHNIEFDLNFLRAELSRCQRLIPNFTEHCLDTLRLSKSVFGQGQSCKLSDLVLALNLPDFHEHSALGDVLATYQVLQAISSSDISTAALLSDALENPLSIDLKPRNIEVERIQRPKLNAFVNTSFLNRLVEALPLKRNSSANRTIYLDYLEKAISDGVISESEAGDLQEIALEIGLSIQDISELHFEIFSGLASHAWGDGHLTEFEKSLLDQVARQLGVGEIELEKARTGKGYLEAKSGFIRKGDIVVLTGTMHPPKDEVARRIIDFGAQVSDSLTKSTNLLVAADPNTLSGKGQKARRYGVPIVSTMQLLAELDA